MKNGLIVSEDGAKRWYEDDLLHREGAPAVESPDGINDWYFKGKHQGTSISNLDGTYTYYIDRGSYKEKEFQAILLSRNLQDKTTISKKHKI